MLNSALIEIFTRDLNKLKTEINAYSTEDNIWIVSEGITNSAGNLTLHLMGNLNHFIGTTLGNTGFVRDRDSEFALKNVPLDTLNKNIDDTKAMIMDVVARLTPADYEKPYPLRMGDKEHTTTFMMVHLTVHLDYHLGQINYHRRLLDK